MNYIKGEKTPLPYLLITLLVSISYYGVLAGSHVLMDRDLYWFFYQNSHYLSKSLSEGHFPLWNPFAYNGEPFFAQAQPGVLYPLHWLYAFIPVDELFSRLLILHVALGGIFMALLVRELRGGWIAATIGGVSIAFSGITASLIPLQSSLFAMAWLPFSLWSLVKSLHKDSIRYAILTGAGFAVMVLVGGMEVLAMGFLFITALLVAPRFFPLPGRIPSARRRLILSITIFFSFFLISAAQLIPFYELTRYSYRTAGVAIDEALTWSLHPKEWAYLVMPDTFRQGPPFYWMEQNWLRVIYVGVVPLLLSLAFILKGGKRALGITVIGLGCLLLATGGYIPLYPQIVKWIPGLRSIRYPSKFLMMFGFLVALAAALGWDLHRHSEKSPSKGKKVPPLFLMLSVFTAILLVSTDALSENIQQWFSAVIERHEFEILPDALLHNLRRFLVLSSISSLAIFFLFKSGRVRRVGQVILPLFLLLDLMGAMPYANVFFPRDCMQKEPERVSMLKERDGIFRIYSHSDIWKKKFPNAIDVINTGTDLCLPNSTMRFELFASQGYRVLTLSRIDQIMTSIHLSNNLDGCRLVDLLNIRYLLWPSEVSSPQYTLIEAIDSLYFYENTGAFDRAFLAESFRVCKTGVEYQMIMEDPAFDPRRTVLLDKDPHLPDGWGEAVDHENGKDQVEILHYGPERVLLKVRSDGPKFLVLSDAYYPGWRAEVNGSDTEIYRADYAFRAVIVDTGESIVEFRYEPDSVLIGAAISSGSILLFLGLLVTASVFRLASRGYLTGNNHLPELLRVKTRSSHQ